MKKGKNELGFGITEEQEILTRVQLKQIRESMKKTQEEFAVMLGYSSNVSISLKESGNASITKRDTMILKNILKEQANGA